MMRIAHVFSTYPNRYQPYNGRLIAHLRSAGIEGDTFSLSTAGPLREGNLAATTSWEQLRFISSAVRRPRLVQSIRRQLDYSVLEASLTAGRWLHILNRSPSLIHVHHVQAISPALLWLLEDARVPWVVSVRGYDVTTRPLLSETDRDFVAERLIKAHRIHAVSEYLRQRAIDLGASENLVRVIRRTVEGGAPVQSVARFDAAVIQLTTSGRFNWTKGFIFLLQAVAQLKRKGVKVLLNICGSGAVDDEGQIRFLIWDLGVADSVVLHGFVSDSKFEEILAVTHVYVQPSINEGLPNTLKRALACRIPVVASAAGGIPEIVDDAVHGLLVPPGDPAAITSAVERLIVDEDLRRRIREAPLKNMSADPEAEVRQYREFYTAAIENYRS